MENQVVSSASSSAPQPEICEIVAVEESKEKATENNNLGHENQLSEEDKVVEIDDDENDDDDEAEEGGGTLLSEGCLTLFHFIVYRFKRSCVCSFSRFM